MFCLVRYSRTNLSAKTPGFFSKKLMEPSTDLQ
jgi:hypothetical protein